MKEVKRGLCLGLLSLTAQAYVSAQTIIVDPITYEIKIVDEDTGEEITEESIAQDEQEETQENNNAPQTQNTETTQEETTKSETDDEETESDSQESQTEAQDSEANNTTQETEEEKTIVQTVTTTTSKSELQQAIDRMHDQSMTIFKTPETYQEQNHLTREQIAKMIDRFYTIMGYPIVSKNQACNFADLNQADDTLQAHIQQTCRLGIFKGYKDNTFKPFNTLTHAELLTLLLRVYNQKSLDETQNPRRQAYATQGQQLNITTLTNKEQIESPITRGDAARYFFRLKNVIESGGQPVTTQSTQNNAGQTTKDSSVLKNIAILGKDINPQNDPQLKEAIHTMYEHGMIGYDQIDNSFLFANATRADVAKILDLFGDIYIAGYEEKKQSKELTCTFSDISVTHHMYEHINNVCKVGLMVGDDENNFLPFNNMSKAQFTAALVRLIDGPQSENYIPRRQAYKEKAQERGIIGDEDTESFEREINNKEVILYLQRLIINHVISKNLDLSKKSNEFLNVQTYDGANNVYIDINFLRTLDNKLGTLTREKEQYKVTKSDIQEYPNFHIARYGDIHDPIDDSIKGNLMLLSDKKRILYGTVRFTEKKVVHTITPHQSKEYHYEISTTQRP